MIVNSWLSHICPGSKGTNPRQSTEPPLEQCYCTVIEGLSILESYKDLNMTRVLCEGLIGADWKNTIMMLLEYLVVSLTQTCACPQRLAIASISILPLVVTHSCDALQLSASPCISSRYVMCHRCLLAEQ